MANMGSPARQEKHFVAVMCLIIQIQSSLCDIDTDPFESEIEQMEARRSSWDDDNDGDPDFWDILNPQIKVLRSFGHVQLVSTCCEPNQKSGTELMQNIHSIEVDSQLSFWPIGYEFECLK